MIPLSYETVVITVSDRVYAGTYQDVSGPAAAQILRSLGLNVTDVIVVPDELDQLRAALIAAANRAHLIVTTGGTGCAPRDVTPEATLSIADRLVPGLTEKMRLEGSAAEPRAWLSRGVAALRGKCLIVNLPGSPKGVRESLAAIAEILPHAIAQANGGGAHDVSGVPGQVR